MSYFQPALISAVQTMLGLYLVAVILRFLLHLLRAELRNPVVQMLVLITNPPLRVLWKFIPAWRGVDLAAVALIVLLGMLKLAAPLLLIGAPLRWHGLLILSLANSLDTVLWVFLFAVLIRVVLSWVAPHSYHPAARVVVSLSEPVLAPFRRLLPPLGGLDLSPILTFLSLRLVQQLLLSPLADWGVSLL